MEKSPIWSRRPLRALRVIWHISTVLVAAMLWQGPFAASAEAGTRQASLSSDLSSHLNSASIANIDVIVTGSSERIARIAARHGLAVKKQLASGAVFSVSKRA